MGAKPKRTGGVKRRAAPARAPQASSRAAQASSRAAQAHTVHQVPTSAAQYGDDDVILVCPWLKGLPEESALWISALPIHDANSFVDGDLRVDAAPRIRSRLYFGVFALDRLRSIDQLLADLRSRGVERLINLPSVTFFDASTAQIFDMLDFNLDQEIAFLLRAKRAGFRVALCARRGTTLSHPGSFDFVLLHDGPGGRMELVAPA
jgi:predicted TIM-barrel enzyme